MKIDFSKYKKIEDIHEDIVSIKIQGATNVAIATFEGLKIYFSNYRNGDFDVLSFLKELEEKGFYLANARPNEPLAKNGVKYILKKLQEKVTNQSFDGVVNGNLEIRLADMVKYVIDLCNEYLVIIENSKNKIIKESEKVFDEFKTKNGRTVEGIFTHCHSSTAVNVINNYAKNFNSSVKVACSETRPLYQGRKTAKYLVEKGIDTTLIVDNSAEYFILDMASFPIDVVFVGTDQITLDGCMINKIGSFGVCLASYIDKDPVYVVGSLLKTDVESSRNNFKIEMRDEKEIWDTAPDNLKIVNPAFELVDGRLITGFITEEGIIKPHEIEKVLKEKYTWLF